MACTCRTASRSLRVHPERRGSLRPRNQRTRPRPGRQEQLFPARGLCVDTIHERKHRHPRRLRLYIMPTNLQIANVADTSRANTSTRSSCPSPAFPASTIPRRAAPPLPRTSIRASSSRESSVRGASPKPISLLMAFASAPDSPLPSSSAPTLSATATLSRPPSRSSVPSADTSSHWATTPIAPRHRPHLRPERLLHWPDHGTWHPHLRPLQSATASEQHLHLRR